MFSHQDETMNKLVSEVGCTVIRRQNDLHLALGVAQLRLEGDASLAGQVGVLVGQQRP